MTTYPNDGRPPASAPNGYVMPPPAHAPLRSGGRLPEPDGFIDFSTVTVLFFGLLTWATILGLLGLSLFWSLGETHAYAETVFGSGLVSWAFSIVVQFGAQPLFYASRYTRDPVVSWSLFGVAVFLNLLDAATNVSGYALSRSSVEPYQLPDGTPDAAVQIAANTGYAVAVAITFAEEGIARLSSWAFHLTAMFISDLGVNAPEWMWMRDE